MQSLHKSVPLVREWDDAPTPTQGMNAADLDALRAFYVGSRQQLYTYAVSITGNRETAEDVIHGVFEKILHGRTLPAGLGPYVFRAVRNAAFDAWRRTKVRTDSIFDVATTIAAREPNPPGPSGVDDLDPLLQQLSPNEREAVVLKIFADLTFQQIADLRRVPLPTVASWYRRGLERLRNLLIAER